MKKNEDQPRFELRSVPIEQLVGIKEQPDEFMYRQAMYRIAANLRDTGHPFHHLTADGTVVDADPTLEYALSRIPALPAVPVDRRHYGFDPYAGE